MPAVHEPRRRLMAACGAVVTALLVAASANEPSSTVDTVRATATGFLEALAALDQDRLNAGPATETRAAPDTLYRDRRDDAAYPVVRIGPLEWLGRNLEFAAADSSCYDDRADDCSVNGRLYSWDAALSACPADWRLPTDDDWGALEAALGMPVAEVTASGARGTDQGLQLQPGGTSGLNVRAVGYRRPTGEFVRRGERAAFWAATPAGTDDAWHRDVRPGVGTIYRSPVTKTYALSVRCVR